MAESGKNKASKRRAVRAKRQKAREVEASEAVVTAAAEDKTEVSGAPQAVAEAVETPPAVSEPVIRAEPQPIQGTALEQLMKVSPFRAKVIARIVEKLRG